MIVQKRGKGIVRYRHNNRYIKRSGSGLSDFLKPMINVVKGILAHKDTISKVVETAKDVYRVGQNTKEIIQSIRKPQPIQQEPEHVETVINRINNLRIGKGFAYV